MTFSLKLPSTSSLASRPTTWLVTGLVGGISVTLLSQVLYQKYRQYNKSRPVKVKHRVRSYEGSEVVVYEDEAIQVGVESLIGDTKLVLIKSLSLATGCRVLAKAEFLNPGGSPKDRVGLSIIKKAEADGLLVPHKGYTLYEGTVGSTGISLAMLCRARGYSCHIVMPDDQAQEKILALRALGATVELVRPASIVDPGHFVNVARSRATADPRGFFADQFENVANVAIHQETTGKEILQQTAGRVDAFIAGAGTGGTLSGVALSLKRANPDIFVALADPQGSGLFHKIRHGILYAPQQEEGARRRHQIDSIVEGVGLTRITENLTAGLDLIDSATSVTDQQAVSMSRFLMAHDGIFVGSSSSVNCVGAARLARKLGPGHTIVTLLCDSGSRHGTKFWSDQVMTDQFQLDVTTPTNLDFLGPF